MPKFSIVIPVYNVEDYIERCLESIKKQTFKDYEVIVVDDGCTDKSIEIAKQYDVKVIKTEHVSVSEARNVGVKHTKGEYLIFLDSDDYWDNDLLNEINKSLDNNPDLVRFQVRTVTDTGEITDYNEKKFKDLSGKQAFDEICKFIKQLQRQEEEHIRKLQRTSYTILTGEKNVTASDFDYNKEDGPEEELSLNGSNLFTGMKQEVDIILTAIHLI